jgi:hypothetical protein
MEYGSVNSDLPIYSVKHHALKMYGGMAAELHTFTTTLDKGDVHLQAPTGERELDGPQSRFDPCGEKKNLLPLPGIEPLSHSLARRQVTVVTELSRIMAEG